jgi:hypothetical protein
MAWVCYHAPLRVHQTSDVNRFFSRFVETLATPEILRCNWRTHLSCKLEFISSTLNIPSDGLKLMLQTTPCFLLQCSKALLQETMTSSKKVSRKTLSVEKDVLHISSASRKRREITASSRFLDENRRKGLSSTI